MGDYEDGFNAGIDAAAKAADYWGAGNWRADSKHRSRFSIYDLQAGINTTGRAIAEDIRALRLCEDEGCPNHGTPHVCVSRTEVAETQAAGALTP